MIAALFVAKGGVYYGLPDVDPWDEARDARKYAGPWPVVAHPPCARWSTLANIHGRIGEDGGCFEKALECVRKYGGVLEHPAFSMAWEHFGLPKPNRYNVWQKDIYGCWCAEVSQANYGHEAIKLTWLYARVPLLPPELCADVPVAIKSVQDDLGKKARAATPIPFRDLLLSIARSCLPRES